MVVAARHLPLVQQLSWRFSVVGTVVFCVRSLAQIKLNHRPQQHFGLIRNGRLILPALLMGHFNFIPQRSLQIRELICIPLLRDVLRCL